jgi:hypothetical protein
VGGRGRESEVGSPCTPSWLRVVEGSGGEKGVWACVCAYVCTSMCVCVWVYTWWWCGGGEVGWGDPWWFEVMAVGWGVGGVCVYEYVCVRVGVYVVVVWWGGGKWGGGIPGGSR